GELGPAPRPAPAFNSPIHRFTKYDYWNYWRQRFVRHGGVERSARGARGYAIRRAFGAVCDGNAPRPAGCVSGAARGRTPVAPERAEFPREHFRVQDARRGVPPVGECGWLAQGTLPPAGHARARSILRPHERTRVDIFRGRPGRARRIRPSV